MLPYMTRVTGGDARTGLGQDGVVLLDGSCEMSREALGSKGFGINLMRFHGLPVPPAFCLPTDVCAAWLAGDDHALDARWPDVLDKLQWLERETARTFGRGPRPLLLSVRSGAARSMPGMLDTVLDLGIDDAVHEALAVHASPEFAADTRTRFESMYRRIVLRDSAAAVPADPFSQLRSAIEAVFDSWNSPRARTYRAHHGLDGSAGTAVVIQAMVFGNLARDSGTGVLFSRNPATGADEPMGEWLSGAQGEDVVSGTFDCQPLEALQTAQPRVYDELLAAARALEHVGRDVQDIEFTVEEGRLWLLQTRVAKRSPQAAVRLALRFREDGLIDDAEALRRVTPDQVRALLSPSLQPETRLAATLLATGLAASPGVASGTAYTDVDAALEAADEDADVILVRTSTSPDDVAGMLAARAIVTELGGATSHAAVVSRELALPAVVGCGAGVAARLAGRTITVDGGAGEVYDGVLKATAWSERDNPDLVALAAMALRVSKQGDAPLLATLTALHTAEGMADE
ncbi:MAG: pyruvate phosphate dikinase [Mycobacterium sp.]|jgi:pyruvate,orthophosphate dikinase|nr:pyruvate phosphate dikinase [Mycobacterium sp.]